MQMQYFDGQLPTPLLALPPQARRELAALLLADAGDESQSALPADIQAALASVAERIHRKTEALLPLGAVISELKAKHT